MDNLRLAFKLIGNKAKTDRAAGRIPAFLGPRGMLALMYDSITKFSEDEDDNTEYLLELAVRSLFAFSLALPDDIDIESRFEDEDDRPMKRAAEPQGNEDDSEEIDQARWTAVEPGQDLPGGNNSE